MKRKKLNNEQLSEIFIRWKIKRESQSEIAKDFNVAQPTIANRLKYFSMEAYVDSLRIKDIEVLLKMYHMKQEEFLKLVAYGTMWF